MYALLIRVLVDDEAQDLIEYALLVAFVGLAAMAAFVAVQNAIAAGYIGWDTAEQALWEAPAPQ
jgi:Flp pilus assembly pilin Flp